MQTVLTTISHIRKERESKTFDLVYFIYMKRAIFVLIFLTVVVTLPPFYLQWAESQRLSQIQKVKQQARPIFGERLETVLSELKSSESPSVIILYHIQLKYFHKCVILCCNILTQVRQP